MAYTAWSVTYGEQPSATKWNQLGSNDAFFEDFIIGTNSVHAAWASWTPTWTNFTIGNGTTTGKYIKYGTTVLARLNVVLGTTSSVGTGPYFTLPVTSATYTLNQEIGQCYIEDSGTAGLKGVYLWRSTTTCLLSTLDASATYLKTANITSTVPMTWATSDTLTNGTLIYEAAS